MFMSLESFSLERNKRNIICCNKFDSLKEFVFYCSNKLNTINYIKYNKFNNTIIINY